MLHYLMMTSEGLKKIILWEINQEFITFNDNNNNIFSNFPLMFNLCKNRILNVKYGTTTVFRTDLIWHSPTQIF